MTATVAAVTRPLRTRHEYQSAMAEVDALLDEDPRKGTSEHDRLDLLAVLIGAYEDRQLLMDAPVAPRDLVAFMMEQRGVTRGQLADWLGGRSRVSEFFRGRRTLSLAQIRILRDRLGIPADLLIS
jgi:HTH-type transcriptional regulator/antitoxin HigA